MKTSLLSALVSLVPIFSFGGEPLWTFETNGTTIRQVDYSRACRIETDGNVFRLLWEKDGKLVPYFESKSPGVLKSFLQQVRYNKDNGAPPYAPVAGGAYVVLKNVVFAEYAKVEGVEHCTLRGFEAELGRVTDPFTIGQIKARLIGANSINEVGAPLR